MMWPILVAVLIILLVWRCSEKNHLDELPGPKRHPIIGCVFTFLPLTQITMFTEMRKFAKIYGDRYLIKILSRRILHIHNPNDVEVVLSHSRNISKNMIYTFLKPWLGDGLILSTGYKWHVRRKILTPTFHFNILKNFALIIEETTREVVDKLKRQPVTELNLYPVVSHFTLCTICETAMGTQLGKDKSAATVEYKSAIVEMGNLIMNRITRVWLRSDFIYKRVERGQYFYKALQKIHSFADNVILERKMMAGREDVSKVIDGEVPGIKKRLAMLDLLLKAESEGQIDLEGIREEVNTFMFAGHDTTAAAITYALMLLADHDDVQVRVYEECQRIFGDSERVANMSDLTEMKYLEAVIKESLRLYPSVPFIARTITEDFMMGDLLVKKGTEIGVHIYDLHRRPDLYPDPESFKPDRFLDGAVRHTYGYVPFSAGPRNCIGQRFAMQEMKCFLSEICRNFKLQPRVKGWRPVMLADTLLRPAEPIYVTFIRRDK